MFGSLEQRLLGKKIYAENCMVCHGALAISSGVTPDLRWSYISADTAAWESFVLDGVAQDQGMVSFEDRLSPTDIEAVRAYVLQQANVAAACNLPDVCDVLK